MQEIKEHLNVIGQVIVDYWDESISDEIAIGLIALAVSDWIKERVSESLLALDYEGGIL